MNYELRIKKNLSSLISYLLSLNSERGQTLLIVVLVMVVALTIGLSVASRSIISLRTATEEENSQRAFSAAEAGVEKALKSGGNVGVVDLLNVGTTSKIQKAEIKNVGGTAFLLKNGSVIKKDEGGDIWLSTYPNYTAPFYNGNLTIRWKSNGSDCSSAAMEIIVIYDSASPKTKRYVFDPCSSRTPPNNFSSATAETFSSSGITFSYKSSPITISNGLIARAIPLYQDTPILIQGTVALPNQAKQVDATGESGGTVRQVSYYQGFPELPPEFFQYVLFQPIGLP